MPSSPLPESPPLSLLEARVLGCLIEKEFTTPDLYPLSMNALVNACNQRNNRSPVLSVGATEVEAATDLLRQRKMVTIFSGADARVPKFRQILDTNYPLDPTSRALLAELLLRGPQTAASLRANAERLQPMPELSEVEQLLEDLAARPAGSLVRRLGRQAGQKELRWAQLFTGEPAPSPTESGAVAEPLKVSLSLPPETEERIRKLESEVAALRAELSELRKALGS